MREADGPHGGGVGVLGEHQQVEPRAVVEGQREIAPMRVVEDVPMGLGSLWYAAKSPQNAWRLLAPTVTFKDGPTVDKVPPPIFRWGP